jgi:TonB family protein
MNKSILTILILAFTTICFGQTTQTKYFNSEWLGKEVAQDKAKFSQTIIQNADGTVTTEITDIKKSEIVRSETFKGNEPYGIWKLRYGKDYKTIDYNFPLIYSDEKCNDSLPIKTNDFFQDNDSLNYKAPKISTGELTIYQFIGKNVIYPTRAKEGIQGTVYLQLTLTKEGTFENIVVKRGTNILLDKEAVRVLRQLKFSSPPTINGQAYTFKCLALPIKYRLM